VATVTVRYWAGARAAAGRDDETLGAASVDDLVATLSARTPALAPVLALSSLLVDGLVVREDLTLADGQVVEVLPPFAGG
jgi:molybdopterin synthase sulfur carrier subunit